MYFNLAVTIPVNMVVGGWLSVVVGKSQLHLFMVLLLVPWLRSKYMFLLTNLKLPRI